MKRLAVVVAFVLLFVTVKAQEGFIIKKQNAYFQVLGIDTTIVEIPVGKKKKKKVKAYELTYLLLDTSRKTALQFQSEDLKLNIGNYTGKIMEFEPVRAIPSQVSHYSILLVIDISGSMAFGNLDIARKAANTFIDATPGGDEIAIMAFNDQPFLVQDFTLNKNLAKKAVNSLYPYGGTNYNAVIYEAENSAVEVMKNAAYKNKVVIFLTDGYGELDLDEALKQFSGIKFYAVTVNLNMPEELRKLSSRTGGFFASDVTNTASAIDFYVRVLKALKFSPGRVVFTLEVEDCKDVVPEDYKYLSFSVGDTLLFKIPVDFDTKPVSVLAADRDVLDFGYVPAGDSLVESFTLSVSSEFLDYLQAFELSDAENFSVNSGIKPGDALTNSPVTVKVVYKPVENKFITGNLTVRTKNCASLVIPIYAGSPALFDPEVNKNLRVVYPNGGEVFYAGEPVDVRWTGVPFDANVKLRLQTPGKQIDLGQGTNFAKNISVPKVYSDKAKIIAEYSWGYHFQFDRTFRDAWRVYHLRKYEFLIRPRSAYTAVVYNALADTNLFFYKAKRKRNKTRIRKIRISPGGRTIALGFSDNKHISVYDEHYGNVFNTKLKYKNFFIADTALFVVTPKLQLYYFNLQSGEKRKIPVFNRALIYAQKIIPAGDGYLVESARNLFVIKDIFNPTSKFIKLPKLHYVLKDSMLYYYAGDKIYVLNSNLKKSAVELLSINKKYKYKAFDVTGDTLLLWLNNILLFIDIENKQLLRTLRLKGKYDQSPFLYCGIRNFPDDYRLMAYDNRQVEFWSDMHTIKEVDSSDDYFTIKPVIFDVVSQVNLGKSYKGNSISKIVKIAENKLNANIKISKLELESPTGSFSLLSYNGEQIVRPFSGFYVEIQYKSDTVGADSALLRIYAFADTMEVPVYARTVELPVRQLTTVYDFGKVKVNQTETAEVPLLVNNSDIDLTFADFHTISNVENVFSLDINSYVVHPGDTLFVTASFTPKSPGQRNTQYLVYFKELLQPIKLELKGESSTPRIIKYNLVCKNALTLKPVYKAQITIYERDTLKLDALQTSKKGTATFNLRIDNIYRLYFSRRGFYPKDIKIDLTGNIGHLDKEQNLQVFLDPRIRDTVRVFTFHFATGKALITSGDRKNFKHIVEYLQRHPEVKILVEGHTDIIGSDESNVPLSKLRAVAVRNLLVSSGVSPDRIIIRYYGEKKPVASNSTEEGRSKNRRAEVKLYK